MPLPLSRGASMNSEVQPVQSPASTELPALLASSKRAFAVSNIKNARMEELMRILTMEELRAKMKVLGISDDPALRAAPLETKISALTSYCDAYLPLREAVTFVSMLQSKIREVYSAKKFGSEEFRLFFHAHAAVMRGERLRPLPPSLSGITGTGFTLTGPSLMGRTALLQRLAEILGETFAVNGEHPLPARMLVMPLLYLPYPTCGTLRGLFRDMRQKVMTSIGHYDMNVNALPDLDGPNAENVAIALCTLLNVGVVALDGCGSGNVNGRTEEILRFLLKLRQFTGIPVLISGTSAFMYSTSYMGNLASNLFNGPSLHLNPIAAPSLGKVDDDPNKSKQSVWYQMNMWHWERGLVEQPCPMPKDLPIWTYQMTFGRLGWLAQGFESLHIELLTKPGLPQPGALTESILKKIFELRLQLHNRARSVMEHLPDIPSSKWKFPVLTNLDHFTTATLNQAQVRDWMDEVMWRRT